MTKDKVRSTEEALRLALEALETPWNAPYVDGCDLALGKKVKAITAIKEALANEALEKMAENARELGLDYEPPQEPVAWKLVPRDATDEMLKAMDECSTEGYDERLYAGHAASVFMAAVDAAPAPPQRTWIGLTDGEVDKMILLMGFPPDWITENAIVKNIVRNLEAKLKEKNT